MATSTAGSSTSDPLVSVIVPTRHEADNVEECYRQVAAVLGEDRWELVFVDDSDDDTPRVIEAISELDPRVSMCHRSSESREGGLGGAVARGFALARGEVLVVMDADLQHPPKLVPELSAAVRNGEADVAVASRYVGDGSTNGLDNAYRRGVSRASRSLALRLLPMARQTTDPLSGFFALRRSVIEDVPLQPDGYKILLEVLERGRWDDIIDIPYVFEDRFAGESKSDVRQGLRFLRHAWGLRRAHRRAVRTPVIPDRRRSLENGDRLRVLILTSEAPPVVSGFARTVGLLQRGLLERGHEVDIVSRSDFPRLMRHEIRISAFALFWPRVRRNLPTYDVVNLHGPVPTMSEMFLLLIRTMRRTERPAVVYTHQCDIAIPKLERWCAIYNKLAEIVAHSADVVVTSSHAYREKIGRVDGSPVEVIPWPVDAPVVASAADRVPNRTDPLKVLFVGQLRSYKGVHVLIDAAAELENVELTVIGDGPLRPELEAQAYRADPTGKSVTMAGRLPDDALWAAYAEHDVIVLPSLTPAEAYGMVLAEGMTAGCVPVASDLPGVAEVAADTGLVVRPGSVESLREALLTLERDRDLLQKLSEDSLVRANSLTIDGMVESYERVFRSGIGVRAVERGRLAVPSRWAGPDELLRDLQDELGIENVSVALVDRHTRMPHIRVWNGDEEIATSDVPASRLAFSLDKPTVVEAAELHHDAQVLLDHQDATSAIFIPLRRSRRAVSLIGLSTVDGAAPLGENVLRQAMALLHAPSRERLAAA